VTKTVEPEAETEKDRTDEPLGPPPAVFLRVLVASASIELMSISPAIIKAKSPSKFHGAYHQQLRQQAERRRIEAFRLFIEGRPVAEIAAELSVDYSTAWRYIRQELRACRTAMIDKVMLITEQQSHQLDRLVGEACQAWERSCRTGVRKVSRTDKEGATGMLHETKEEFERGPGDIRFLELALKALAAIRALYGIGVQELGKQAGFTAPVRYTTRWGG